MQHRPAIALLATLLAAALPGHAGESAATSLLDSLSLGILAHDYGPLSDRHENGIDPNLELRFRPPDWAGWRAIGTPRPHLGVTPNFSHDTSVLYAGVTWAFDPHPRLFTEIGLGLALHDGPLHAEDPVACDLDSDCGFGSRILPHFSLELGVRLDGRHAVTLYFDHVSHMGYLDDENEGIDHLGLRYRIRY
jgi:hypothetical protein